MKYVVVGAGATGAVIGAFFALAGEEVWLVDPYEAHMRACAERGLIMHPAGYEAGAEVREYVVPVHATTVAEEAGIADVVVFMPKGSANRIAMESVVKLCDSHTLVLTLQNGLGHTDGIAEHIAPDRIAYGITTIASGMPAPGVVEPRMPAEKQIWIGSDYPENRALLEQIAATLRAGGVDANVDEMIKAHVWEKFALNCAGNATMALLRLNARQAATSQDYMDVREEVLHEIDRIAAAKGIHLDPTVVYGLGDKAVPMEGSFLPESYTSMAQDVMHHRRTEVEYLNLAAVREAESVGMKAPFNECLGKMIRALEQTYEMQF